MIVNDKPQRQRVGIFQHLEGFSLRNFPVMIGLDLDVNRAFFPQHIANAQKCVERQRRAVIGAAEHPVADAVMFQEIADLLIVG